MKNKALILSLIFLFTSNIIFALSKDELDFFQVVKEGNVQRVNELLEKPNLNINAKDSEGYTPLMRAVFYNQPSSVNTLLQARGVDKEARLEAAEINGWYLDGSTSVMLAAFFGYTDILTILVDNGASLDATDNIDNALAIHIAAANGRLDTVKRILSYDKKYANARTSEESTPLIWAAMKDKKDVVEYLSKLSDLEAKDVEGWTALHYASAFSSPTTVATIISAGADVNSADNEGVTPLLIAKDNEIKSILLQNGASSTGDTTESIERPSSGETVETVVKEESEVVVEEPAYEDTSEYLDSLQYKNLKPYQIQFILNIKDGDILAINKYISTNSDVNFTNDYGFTPMSYAVVYNRADSLEELLKSTNLNKNPEFAKDTEYEGWYLYGATPLILAAYMGYDDIVSLLLSSGVDLYKRDKVDGTLAIHAAAANGSLLALRTIINFDNKNIDIKDSTGFTPLHWASMYSKRDIVAELLGLNADPNLEDNEGVKPIHIAAQYGENEIVKMLIDAGADINAVDGNDNTALHLATYSSYSSTVRILIDNRADKSIINIEDKKPIDIALENENTEIIKILNSRDKNTSKWWIIY